MTGKFERAVLAGGCFWGMQDLIRKPPGVVKTRVGYTGGDVPNATYRSGKLRPGRGVKVVDGVGFDRARFGGSGGLGLIAMRERAGQLNGTFEFDSAPIPFRMR